MPLHNIAYVNVFRPCIVPELPDRLVFYLSYSLARDAELPSDTIEGSLSRVVQTVSHLDDAAFRSWESRNPFAKILASESFIARC